MLESVLKIFVDEAQEQLDELDRLLIAIEADHESPELLNEFMGVAHTLKGSAGSMGFEKYSETVHLMESTVERLRGKKLAFDRSILELLFRSLDSLREALGVLQRDQAEPSAQLELLHAELAALVADEESSAPKVGTPQAHEGLRLAESDTARLRVLEGRGLNFCSVTARATGPRSDVTRWGADVLQCLRDVGEVVASNPPEARLSELPWGAPLSVLVAADFDADSLYPLILWPEQTSAAVTDYVVKASDHAERASAARFGETIRIDLARVDNLLEMIGELVISEAMVANAPDVLSLISPHVRDSIAQLTKITRDLQEMGMRMRMVEVRSAFQRMARVVRDLSAQTGKEVALTTSGETAEMDRSMVDKIVDPLMHLVRNAVDHGIEAPEVREQAKKPRQGTIRLQAYHQGGNIVIEVSDDGAGLDCRAIRAKAEELGLIEPGVQVSDADLTNLIFVPGLTTAKALSEISGRGVGMDVVRRTVESLRGCISVVSQPGLGTTFKLVLPLTLAIIDGMLVSCGRDRYILPTLSILESMRPTGKMLLFFSGQQQLLFLRGETLPLIRLASIVQNEGAEQDATRALVVVLESMGRKFGLLVDDVLLQQQVVIKSIGDDLEQSKLVSGAAILPDGRVGLILNVDEIGALALRPTGEVEAATQDDAQVVQEQH